jgi:DNA/RNA-binding domain of Phe-tRNA-synthetase-like protein
MREGSIMDDALAQDFPALAVLHASRALGGGAYRRASKERLARLGDRIGGELVAAMRQQAVPGAYRAFARQVGLDPDGDATPLERTLMERIRAGRFVPASPTKDPCTVAMLETGVPVWALDEDRVSGPLRLGSLAEDDVPALAGTPAGAGEIAVWDDDGPLALLLGDIAPDAGPTRRTRAVRLFALRVEGVPDASVREALWTAAQLTGPDPA